MKPPGSFSSFFGFGGKKMAKIIEVTAANIASALSGARRALGAKFKNARENLRSGGEDGCYQVYLENGDTVEAYIRQHAYCKVHSIFDNDTGEYQNF